VGPIILARSCHAAIFRAASQAAVRLGSIIPIAMFIDAQRVRFHASEAALAQPAGASKQKA
jgi:hypothetical protein